VNRQDAKNAKAAKIHEITMRLMPRFSTGTLKLMSRPRHFPVARNYEMTCAV
jgi:hypothetical protein